MCAQPTDPDSAAPQPQPRPQPDIDEMIRRARAARQHAYAPYSSFAVGACLRSTDGSIHAGCNVENASFPLGHCAETSALGALISSGATPRITDIVVVTSNASAPCGGCRQKLSEHALPEASVYLCDGDGVRQTLRFRELLPLAFDGNTLRRPGSPA